MKLTREDIERFLGDKRSDDYRELCSYLLFPFQLELGGRDLTEGAVKRYVGKRYEEPSSGNTFLAVMKSFCEWKKKRLPQDDLKAFVRDRQVLELIQDIKRDRVVRRVEKKGLTLEEIRGVLNKYPRDSLDFSIIWLLLYFGVRPGELVALEPRMVDFRRGVVNFITEKTKVERSLPFDGFTATHLKRFLDARPSYAYVYKYCKEAGIEPKAGRQSFISHMQRRLAKADFDPVRMDLIVKTAAGHTTSDITGVYTDLPEDIGRMMRELHYLKPVEAEYAQG